MTTARTRFLLALGPLSGILLASIYSLFALHTAGAQQTEAEAHKMGFASAAQMQAVFSLPRWVDYTPAQFALLQDTLQHTKGLSQVVAIGRFSRVRSLDQKRHALSILKPYITDKTLQPPVSTMLYDYYASPDSRPLVEGLTRDPDPAIAALAKKTIADVEQDTRDRAARAERRKQRQGNGTAAPPKQ